MSSYLSVHIGAIVQYESFTQSWLDMLSYLPVHIDAIVQYESFARFERSGFCLAHRMVYAGVK